MRRKNGRPYRSDDRLVHGLLRCKTCYNIWNRDCNGATNIYKIAYNTIHKGFRPHYLCRNTNQPTRYKKGSICNNIESSDVESIIPCNNTP